MKISGKKMKTNTLADAKLVNVELQLCVNLSMLDVLDANDCPHMPPPLPDDTCLVTIAGYAPVPRTAFADECFVLF